MVQRSPESASARSASRLASRYGFIGLSAAMSCVPIELTIRKRSTPSSRAASMHLTAPPRSMVTLRAAPLPAPAPAANTIASAPPTCGSHVVCLEVAEDRVRAV